MYKTQIRVLCFCLILTLCIPMAACGHAFDGGLVGELLDGFRELESMPDNESQEQPIDPWESMDTGKLPVDPDVITEPVTEDYPIDTAPPADTTSPIETEPDHPLPPELVKVIAGMSWDTLVKVGNGVEGEAVFADSYAYMQWETNPVANIDHLVDGLRVWGWIAFFTETEGTIGYSINGGETVYGADFTHTAEQGVQDHIAAGNVPGAMSACRMNFTIPTADLAAGEHTVALYAKDPDSNQELIKEFKVIKTMPYVENAHSHFSVDALSLNGIPYIQEGQVIAQLGAMNNTVTVTSDQPKNTITMRGWAAFTASTAVAFGYYIGDDITIVTDPSYTQERSAELANAGIANGQGYNMTVSIADVPAGTHPVGLIAKLADGTYAQFFSFWLRIVPATEDQTVVLGDRASASLPISGPPDKKLGQKIPLGQSFLKQVTIRDLATYADGCINTWSFKVWKWNTDYATTVAISPLLEIMGVNHQDNANFVVDIPIELLISGDIYYELEYLSGSGTFTGWSAENVPAGVETYVNGRKINESYAASLVVGVEADSNTPSYPTEPAPSEPEAPAPEGNGTLEAPLTVTQALAACADLTDGTVSSAKFYAKGTITQIGESGGYYKNVYFSDGTTEMLIYTLNPMDGMGELQVGDVITVHGFIKNYLGTIEFASNGSEYVYIVAID